MNIPEYVSKQEVKRVCEALKLRDWSDLADPVVTIEEAALILNEVNTSRMDIPVETFRAGLEVELEHGTRFKDANVTNNHPLLTGKIVLAHLKETMDYYQRLDVAELEGDLLKAARAGNAEKALSIYRRLLTARAALSAAEAQAVETSWEMERPDARILALSAAMSFASISL